MCCSGKLEAAADDPAVQSRDDRHLAELNFFECAMPQARVGYSLRNVALLKLRQIKTGREVFALARNQHGADPGRRRGEKLLDANDCLVVEGIAFLRAIKLQHNDAAMPFGGKRGRQLRDKVFGRHSPAHTVSSQTIMALQPLVCNLSS